MKSQVISYLRDVLGLTHLYGARENPPDKNQLIESSQLFFQDREGKGPTSEPLDSVFGDKGILFLNWVQSPGESLFIPSNWELFQKMIQAMSLNEEDWRAYDCFFNNRPQIPAEVRHFFQNQFVVFFSQNPEEGGGISLRGGFHWLEAFSPNYMLNSETSKKTVWWHLKKLLAQRSASKQ